ncbi:MAG TPA: Shedu anti-phage system protein SduA domain-containing protein, partial [Albitalea sp.]
RARAAAHPPGKPHRRPAAAPLVAIRLSVLTDIRLGGQCQGDLAGRIRYRRDPDDPLQDETVEVTQPKSELTLDNEEFQALLTFLQESYEPFRQGVKAFIPLDRPYDPANAAQIRALFSLPDKRQLVRFILSNDIIPEDLAAALQHARRARALKQFERMLEEDRRENDWQAWFQKNRWILGSEFVRVLDERTIDVQHISDFLMEAYDGFLDIVEIKRPEGGTTFWSASLDHGNYVQSADLTKAIAQASRYIFEVEREANSLKFLQRVGGIRTVKPRCILIFGRSSSWNAKQVEAFRILNAGLHNVAIMTYDHVLERARRMLGIDSRPTENITPSVRA